MWLCNWLNVALTNSIEGIAYCEHLLILRTLCHASWCHQQQHSSLRNFSLYCFLSAKNIDWGKPNALCMGVKCNQSQYFSQICLPLNDYNTWEIIQGVSFDKYFIFTFCNSVNQVMVKDRLCTFTRFSFLLPLETKIGFNITSPAYLWPLHFMLLN